MNTQPRKFQVLSAVILLAMLALITSACSFHTGNLGNISQVIDITIDEDMFNPSSPNFTVNGHDFWSGVLDDVDRVECHDGYLRFVGTHRQANGSRVKGSIDMSLGAENNRLIARVVAVDIPGIEFDDPEIVEINDELEADLSSMDFEPGSEVLFKEVQVTEDGLRMKIKVKVQF